MLERSTVLEENSRLNEERDRLEKARNKENEEVEKLKEKLEHTRRLLKVNMEETVSSNARRTNALQKIQMLEEECSKLAEERDEIVRRSNAANVEPVVDLWNTHVIQLNLPFAKTNLGIVLGGGRADDGNGPLYVKQILNGSPFENFLKIMDHVMMVNEISVADMDERSVMEMLANCHHLQLVVRRRADPNSVLDVQLPINHEVGLKLANGVFINSVDAHGSASRAGLAAGQRLVHVLHTPVYDAKHAELLIKNAREPLVIGVLQNSRNLQTNGKEKQKTTLFSKWFGRSTTPKGRNVVASASIGSEDPTFLRQGSLRIPHPQVSPLVRYGSLRAPQADHSSEKNPQNRFSITSDLNAAQMVPWSPTSVVEEEEEAPCYVSPVFSGPSSPASRIIRYKPARQSSTPKPFSPEGRPFSMHLTPSFDRRVPLPLPHRNAPHAASAPRQFIPLRENSLSSSLLSSSNSLRQPSTSFSHYYTNNSTSSMAYDGRKMATTKEEESDQDTASVCHSLQSNRYPKRDRVLDLDDSIRRKESKEILGSTTQCRWMMVPRNAIQLCGGNAIGILAEGSIGELVEGDLILEIDEFNVRNATLEDALDALHSANTEFALLLIQDGGDRLNRLRLGADGDSFYVRVNVDRAIENKDELDLKAGEVLFVDKTMFAGQRGRWRAWKVDKEGRQRENGVIPSSESLQNFLRTSKRNRNMLSFTRKVYEKVQRVSPAIRRPVIIYGPLTAPFLQALLDDSKNFVQCVSECKALSDEEVTSLLGSGELIEAKRRERLYDVITFNCVQNSINEGLHGVLQVGPAAVQRLQDQRIFPIVIKLKFKSAKQIKELKEELFNEKISTKQAKEMIEKAFLQESELGGVSLVVSNHNTAKMTIKHVTAQLRHIVEEEQRKIVWVSCE